MLEREFRARQDEVLEVAMRGKEDGRGRVLVVLAGLQAEDPVLDHVVAAHAVPSSNPVQLLDQGDARESLSVESDRDSLLELDPDLLHSVGGREWRYRPGVDLLRRVEGRVFEVAALDAPAPEVLVDAVGLILRHGHGDVVLLCVADLPLAGQVHLPHRCNDIVPGGPEDEVEPELVVSLPGAPVCDL
jgi:hypothetical protein